jgi:hypoxanthine phosphoribosyltransferase
MSFINKDSVIIKNKEFVPYINSVELDDIVNKTAEDIYAYYKDIVNEDKPLIIIGVLNGAFMFLSDLVKKLNIHCEIHFIKVSSYEGTESTGKIKNILGLNRNITDQQVLIVEDIIDTGLTIHNLMNELYTRKPKEINICTLFFKKDNYKSEKIDMRFVGKEILNKFIIGYGLDYDNFGRNLNEIYVLDS